MVNSFKKALQGTLVSCTLTMLFYANPAIADDGPPGSITSLQIAAEVSTHYLEYGQFKPIGACLWLKWSIFGPYIEPTPELDEYLPDLVVTVYNKAGDDPWLEARPFDAVSASRGASVLEAITRDPYGNGNTTSEPATQGNYGDVTKSADVIGSPMNLLHIPFMMLRLDTTAFVPYFQSDLDSIPGRFGIAEDLEPETWNPVGAFIGSGFLSHWTYEFPRSMRVDNDNDYKASASIAQHAADIVTNRNLLHVVHSTSDSCGENCAVANVIQETKDDHEIWEEVYPTDRHIRMGESDAHSVKPLGQADEKAGHGNYVFVVWRHYKGCVQSTGQLVFTTVAVPPTVKR